MLPRLSVPRDGPVDPIALFDDARDLWLEIGFGGGEHLAEQAASRPEIGFIGCEPFVNGVARLLAHIENRNLSNIRIFPDDVRLLLDRLPPASVERAFLLFPDPWPKRRHSGRRFIQAATLDRLARVMPAGALLRVASDDMGYIRWTLFHARRHPAFEWTARKAADWRSRPADWPPTRYEEKALTDGRNCVYLAFHRNESDSPPGV